MSNWGCPHEVNEKCTIAETRPCEPGMRGCVLHGRFVFNKPQKKRSREISDKKSPEHPSKTSSRKK